MPAMGADETADGGKQGGRAVTILRSVVWLVIPLTVLLGDALIRFDRGIAEQFTRENIINLPSSVLLSCGFWFAVALLVSQLKGRRRAIVAGAVGALGATAVVAIWQYNLVIHHDPNPGVIVYSLHEPANARKLAESGFTLLFGLSLVSFTALWGAAIYLTRVQITPLIRGSSFLMLLGYLTASIGWHDPSPERESAYVSDVYFGVLIGTAVKRIVSYGNESALDGAERDTVTDVTPVDDAPHVMLFIGESLTRHRMSLYGAERKTTPRLDKWVDQHRDGFVDYSHAWATSAFTPISLASFLTGLYPARDRAAFHRQPVLWQYSHALGGESHVYATQMWTWSNLSLFFLTDNPPTYWATADELEAPIVNDTGIDDRIAAGAFARSVVEHQPKNGPALMIYQANATHYPLLAHEAPGFPVNNRVDEYDAAIRVVDESFGIVVDGLEKAEILDDTVIIFMADHGEFDWDLVESRVEGREIAVDLIDGERIESCHPTLANVPFFVWIPPKWRDRLGPRFATMQANTTQTVSLVDIFPTVLDLWGQPIPDIVDGRSLLQPIADDRWAACFTNTPWARWLMNGFALIDGERIIYQREDFSGPQYFDARDVSVRVNQLRGTPLAPEEQAWFDMQQTASPLLGQYREFLRETSRTKE